MQRIQSRENPQIKHIAKLKRSSTYRRKHQACTVEGMRAISAFLTCSLHHINMLYMTEHAYHRLTFPFDDDRITIVKQHVMDKISAMHTPSGILAHVHLGDWQSKEPTSGLCLVEIRDPGNLGTLIRSSVALGYEHVCLISCADPWNPKTIQASAGALAHARLCLSSWQEVLQQQHLQRYALTHHQATPIENIKLQNALILVGNEAYGLPGHMQQEADARIRLHMPGEGESFNAAVAGSIALYLYARQGQTS